MKTTRRSFVTTVAAGAAATAIASPAIAQSRQRVRWNMPTSWPPHLLLQDAATIVAEKVSEMTDGAFEMRVYPAGELVPALEVFGSVQAGTVECAHSWGGYYIGSSTAIQIDAGMPFGLNPAQHTSWWNKGGGRELLQPLYDEFNMLAFLCGDTDAQMAGWFNKEMNSVDDLRGMRLRIAGVAGRIFTALGASTQIIPGGEILTAMERGIIDGLQFNNPYDDLALGLHRVSKYYYYPCFQHPAAPLSLYVNRDAYEALPEDYKKVLEIATEAAHLAHVAHSQNEDAKAFARIREEGMGFEVRAFPDEIMEAASRANDKIVEEFADEDPHFARIYPEWKKFVDDMRAFNYMTHFSYDRHIYS
jgi:TRAP-type mannitol/chloroaromatic compound transport system substrate-binding protein